MEQLKDKSALVTGGAGFIGSNIVKYLLKNGVKFVRVLDNLSTGNKKNIGYLLRKYPHNLEFMYGDTNNLEVCRKAVKTMDLICHQAAIGSVPRSIEDPLTSHMSNINGFVNILIAAKEAQIKRIVYASSSSVYGDSPFLPKKEEQTGKVLSPYAATKAVNEIYAQVFSRCYQMECIGLRYFNVFGPRQDPNGPYAAVIPKFIDSLKRNVAPKINGDGSFSRDFTYVDNVVSANILALTTTNQTAFGDVFNIGAGGRITIRELFDVIRDECHSSLEPQMGPNRDGDIPHSNADISKAQRILGYSPIVTFQQGIKKTVAYLSK